MAIQHRWKCGDKIEAMDPRSRRWRAGIIQQIEPYRGRPGYYVLWEFGPRKVESWESRGGWQPETSVRERGQQ